MGVGKTTVAKALKRLLHKAGFEHVEILAFADVLKKETSEIYGFPIDAAYNDKNFAFNLPKHMLGTELAPKGKTRITVREALQHYGTDVIRARDYNAWVDKFAEAAERIIESCGGNGIIIADDVRFPNEAECIEKNGVCFRINPYQGYVGGNSHSSECALDDYGFNYFLSPEFGATDKAAEEAMHIIKMIYGNELRMDGTFAPR